MSAPVIILKKFHFSESLSEETNAYSAIVNVDGVDAIAASNYGTGGADDYNPVAYTPEGRARFDAAMKTLDEYAKSLPPLRVKGFPEGLAYNTELVIGQLVDAKVSEKAEVRLKAKLRKQSVDHLFLIGKAGVATLRFKVPVAKLMSATFLAKMKAKYPEDTILVGEFETAIWPILKEKLT